MERQKTSISRNEQKKF